MKSLEIRPPKHRGPRQRSTMGFLFMIIAFVVGAAGLVHILTKNKTHAIGRQQREVEQEIAVIQQDMRGLNMKIEEALSRKNLTDKLVSRRSKLKAIAPENIVRVSAAETSL
jgi:hypothetical protein